MTQLPLVIHLIDDTTAGGVTRVVDFICASQALAKNARHQTIAVQRGKFGALPKDAAVIVSHTVISWRTLPALMALRAARPSTPLVHVEHSYTSGFVAHNVSRPGRFASLLRAGFSLFDGVVSVSKAQTEWLKARGLCNPDRLVTIASCIDLQEFRDLPAPNGPVKVLGAIGRLDRQKGFDDLIVAFRGLSDPSLSLLIVGDGAERQNLMALAGDDTRISFAGHIANSKDAIGRVDAVFMPSRWEALGLVAIEALAAGRPLVCSGIDGLQDHRELGAILLPTLGTDALSGVLSDVIRPDTSSRSLSSCRYANHLETKFETAWNVLVKNSLPEHGPLASCALGPFEIIGDA